MVLAANNCILQEFQRSHKRDILVLRPKTSRDPETILCRILNYVDVVFLASIHTSPRKKAQRSAREPLVQSSLVLMYAKGAYMAGANIGLYDYWPYRVSPKAITL